MMGQMRLMDQGFTGTGTGEGHAWGRVDLTGRARPMAGRPVR